MNSDKTQQRLKIRLVEDKHLEQYDELLRYVFQVNNTDLQESGYEEGELLRSKRPVLSRSTVLGWFTKQDELISSLSIYPCKVNIFGTMYAMAGMTGVGTYPEYASKGLMHKLIIRALVEMREQEQWISYLYPYSIPYYRNKGWEIMSDRIKFSIPVSQLPKNSVVPGLVERQDIDHPDVYDTYNRFAQRTHGAMFRSSWNWDEYWRWENEGERTAAIYYDTDNKAVGYMFYWIDEAVFHIKEMIYLTQEARTGLWNFISAHLSMIEKVEGYTYSREPIAFQFQDSKILEMIEPYYMARIVDVENFLWQYPFADHVAPFHFRVRDDQAPWNNDAFGIFWDEAGVIHVVREPLGIGIDLDIQTLTSMLMNYRRPTYFSQIERISVTDTVLAMLENIVPPEQPYFSDYF